MDIIFSENIFFVTFQCIFAIGLHTFPYKKISSEKYPPITDHVKNNFLLATTSISRNKPNPKMYLVRLEHSQSLQNN